jgi:hypothetical protein
VIRFSCALFELAYHKQPFKRYKIGRNVEKRTEGEINESEEIDLSFLCFFLSS